MAKKVRMGLLSTALLFVVICLEVEATPIRRANGFGLEEVISGELSSIGFSGTWVSGTEFIYTNADTGDVYKFDVATLTSSMLLGHEVLEEFRATSYELSADGQFMLIGYDRQAGFRHSASSRFIVYDLVNNDYDGVGGGELLQLVRLSPVGSALVYVFNNDIYYRESGGKGVAERRLTDSGVVDVVYNGIPDWVYEEEVLGSGSALWFSPDGASLAFASFDDTEVKTESYLWFGEPGSLESQYSEIINIRYPKPGTTNPTVTLHVVGLTNPSATILNLPAPVDVVTEDHILFTVTWANEREVAAIWTNRVQNQAQLQIYDVTRQDVQEVYRMAESNGWLDVRRPIFDATGARLVTVLPQNQGDGFGNYLHVTLLARQGTLQATMATETPLTSGISVVSNIYGWDKVNDVIYYQATPENSPSQRHVYSVAADGSCDPVCLSCGVQSAEGRACMFASASFSSDFSHMALTCSGPDPLEVFLYKSTGEESLMAWECNEGLREKLEGRALPDISTNDEIDVADGFKAKVRLWLPPGADTSGVTKYPMLVFVYGGPDSAQISDAFTLGFGAYLTTNRSVIYAMIDGRGSGMKGDAIKFNIYRRLGTVEVIDQIEVARALQQKYPFIDATRSGIWGWSYGGYATAMALALDHDGVFKCGASVAPVTSWIYYDTIYTERYMGLPTLEDNQVAYNNSDVTRIVEGFRGKQFYLLHGNADDNVHYLQAMMLSRALEVSNVLFRQQSYPDENHRLASVLLHVYSSMDQFWAQCFNLDTNPQFYG